MLLHVEPLRASHGVDFAKTTVWTLPRAGAAALLVLLAGLLVTSAVGPWRIDNTPSISRVPGCQYPGSSHRLPHYPYSASDLPEVFRSLHRISVKEKVGRKRKKPLYLMLVSSERLRGC